MVFRRFACPPVLVISINIYVLLEVLIKDLSCWCDLVIVIRCRLLDLFCFMIMFLLFASH